MLPSTNTLPTASTPKEPIKPESKTDANVVAQTTPEHKASYKAIYDAYQLRIKSLLTGIKGKYNTYNEALIDDEGVCKTLVEDLMAEEKLTAADKVNLLMYEVQQHE